MYVLLAQMERRNILYVMFSHFSFFFYVMATRNVGGKAMLFITLLKYFSGHEMHEIFRSRKLVRDISVIP